MAIDPILSSAMQFAAIRRARKRIEFLHVLRCNAGLDAQNFECAARLNFVCNDDL